MKNKNSGLDAYLEQAGDQALASPPVPRRGPRNEHRSPKLAPEPAFVESFRIYASALKEIERSVGRYKAERGCALIGNPLTGEITHAVFDEQADTTAVAYSPDVDFLNNTIANYEAWTVAKYESWVLRNGGGSPDDAVTRHLRRLPADVCQSNDSILSIMGIGHSHPAGFTVLSAQDRIAAYNNITSPGNAHLLTWHMPIIQSKADVGEFGFFPYIVSCQGPGRTRIHKPRLEIIGKSRYVHGCSFATDCSPSRPKNQLHQYHNMLGKRYQRVSNNVDFDTVINTSFIVVGVGASSGLVAKIARQGGKRFYLYDSDRVEIKNLVTQDFEHGDVGKLKVEALKKRLRRVELESGNPAVPSLMVETGGDFMAVSDAEIGALVDAEKAQGRKVMLIFATDFHPVQARGSRLALKLKIPAFWVGVYRGGGAGEIVFWHPDAADLPCYRCITQSRYDHFDARVPSQRKASVSSGLPFATELVDAILGHLIIGAIHRNDVTNPHGRLFERLLREKRNFIQVQMDPGYRLGGDDIFAGITGQDVVTFNTLFQTDGKKHNCADCGARAAWSHTDYLRGA